MEHGKSGIRRPDKIPGKTKGTNDQRTAIKALRRVESGNYVGAMGSGSILITMFGCHACMFRGTPNCPNGIQKKQHHSNKICSVRVKYLKSELEKSNNLVAVVQKEELFKARLLEDQFILDHINGEELHPDFVKIQKNIITLTDKIRRQDEGIKIQGEIDIVHKDFREFVDIEAKKIEERNKRTEQAEFKEEVSDSQG